MLNRWTTFAAAVLMASVATAQEGSVRVKMENFDSDGATLRASFSVENGTPVAMKSIFVDCTFFDGKQKAVVTQVGLVSNVTAGEKAYGTVRIPAEDAVKAASCRFSHGR